MNNQFYEAIIKNSDDAILSKDLNGIITSWNPGAEKIFGYSSEEIIGKHITILFPEELISEEEQIISKIKAGERIDHYETSRVNKAGEKLFVSLSISPIKDEDGKIIGAAKIVRNISLRKEKEKLEAITAELNLERKKLISVLDNAADPIVLINSFGIITIFNNIACKVFGYREEEIIGKNVKILMPNPYHDEHDGYIQNYFESGKAKIIGIPREVYAKKRNGDIFPVELNISRIEATGETLFVGILRDISEKKANEQELQKAYEKIVQNEAELEKQLEFTNTIFNTSDYTIISTDKNGIITSFNKAAETSLGYSSEEMIGKQSPAILHDIEEVKAYAPIISKEIGREIKPGFEVFTAKAKYLGKADQREWSYIRKDGSRFPALLSVNALKNKDNEIYGYLGIAVNLTERKEQEQILSWLVEHNTDGWWDWNLETNQTYLSPGFKKLFGYEDHELPNASETWQKLIHPDDLKIAFFNFDRFIETDGKHPYLQEVRYRCKDGSFKWVICRGVGIRNDQGKFYRMLGTHTDITETKNIQESLKYQTEELRRSNDSLAQFAHIASHDLQEPLRTVAGYTDLLKIEVEKLQGSNPKIDKYQKYINEATIRMRDLIKDILDYSKVGSKDNYETIDTYELIENIEANIEASFQDTGAVLEINSLPKLTANKTEIYQLFQNLISNAIKFMPAGRKPLIKIFSKKVEDNKWQFSVCDNGIGISEEYQDKVFAIFKRLNAKEDYEGTGIGLALCKKVVENHDGKIWYDSVEGKGTSFHFTIKDQEEKAKIFN